MSLKKSKTYLITGIAGFIASRTAELLLARGDTVIGIDNLNDYYDIRLKHYRLSRLFDCENKFINSVINCSANDFSEIKTQNFDLINFSYPLKSDQKWIRLDSTKKKLIVYIGDIEHQSTVESIFSTHKIDSVFNLAARAGVRYSMTNPHVYMTTNANGTLNLLEGCRQHSIEKFILASTSSLYAGQPMPFHEELPVNTPISPYAASKKAAEVMCYAYHNLYNLDVSVVRYFTVFGPAGRPDMSIFRFIKWIDQGNSIELFGDGKQTRDFTYIDDIATGTIAAEKKLGYEIINLGGGKVPIDLLTIINYISDRLNKISKIDFKEFHKADLLETSADIVKAHKLLGWRPEIDPLIGLEKTIEWYINNQGWLKKITL